MSGTYNAPTYRGEALGMGFLVAGIVLMGCMVGLFWLKDELRSPRLARLAYSELTARLTVIALALIIVGAALTLGDLLD